MKIPVSYKFSKETLAILKNLSRQLGLTQTAVLEFTLRQYVIDHPEKWRREDRLVEKRS